MRMRLMSINGNDNIDDTPESKTRFLSFRPVTPPGTPGAGGGMLGSSSLSLLLTKTEANAYTLGGTYDVGATLADNQQPQDGEPSVDAPI